MEEINKNLSKKQEIPTQKYPGTVPEASTAAGPDRTPYQEMPEKSAERSRMFGILALPALIYAAVYTFCLYDNPAGITMPFFVAATVWYVFFIMKKTGTKRKKHTGWYVLMMLLLGISDVLTGNTAIQIMNNLGIFLLLICMLLYHYFDVSSWRLGMYVKGFFAAVFGAVANIAEPFSDGKVYFSDNGSGQKKGKGVYILIGTAVSVPLLATVTALLYFADAVFAEFLQEGLKLDLQTVFLVFLMFAFSYLSAYCGMRYLEKRELKEKTEGRGQWEPIVAITALFLVCMVYIVFCGIQILYLFWGKMELPGDYTYAAYAREGFFQLLFVCVINLCVVLFVQRFFREHGLLKVLLTIVCLCTYVMVASSAFRMVLYIRAYQLTFLRVLVLWSLALIAVLLVGVLLQIWKKDFPLFSYGLVVVCGCYLMLSFGRADYFIAWYNLMHLQQKASEEETQVDLTYLSTLSTDAAPAVYEKMKNEGITLSMEDAGEEIYNDWLDSYIRKIDQETEDSWRQFNVSHAYAKKLFEDQIRNYYDAVYVRLFYAGEDALPQITVSFYEGNTLLGKAAADTSMITDQKEEYLLLRFSREDAAAVGKDIEELRDFGIAASCETSEGVIYETPVCRLTFGGQERKRVYMVGMYGDTEYGYDLYPDYTE